MKKKNLPENIYILNTCYIFNIILYILSYRNVDKNNYPESKNNYCLPKCQNDTIIRKIQIKIKKRQNNIVPK